jgi:ADP-heptose:LPS heptosyltransferase
MSVPVAASIRKAHPFAEIVWAVEPRCSPTIDTDRLITRLAVMDREEWRAGAWSPHIWRKQMLAFARLRRTRFDYGIDLQGHGKTALCLRLAAPTCRIGARAKDASASILNPTIREEETEHTVIRNMEALSRLGDFPRKPEWIMPDISGVELPQRSTRPLATITVGTGHPFKNYPLAKWSEVAKELIKTGFEVAFLGGTGDEAPATQGALNWVGKLELRQTMAAVATSRIHICGDTGTGHIAAAYGTPVVSLFGYLPSRRFAPYTENKVVVERPGSVAKIDVREALGAIEEALSRHVAKVSY